MIFSRSQVRRGIAGLNPLWFQTLPSPFPPSASRIQLQGVADSVAVLSSSPQNSQLLQKLRVPYCLRTLVRETCHTQAGGKCWVLNPRRHPGSSPPMTNKGWWISTSSRRAFLSLSEALSKTAHSGSFWLPFLLRLTSSLPWHLPLNKLLYLRVYIQGTWALKNHEC